MSHIRSLNKPDWNYYSNGRDIRLPSFDSNSDPKYEQHLQFIKKMFSNSEKLDVMVKELTTDSTPNHVSSVFLLGVLLIKHLDLIKIERPSFDDTQNRDEHIDRVTEWIDLSLEYETNLLFIWFLTALYHDFAKEVEGKGIQGNKTTQLKDLYEEYSIAHRLLDLPEKNMPCHHLTSIRNDYFDLRVDKCRKVDHGILAGILLYDRLINIRSSPPIDSKLNWKPEVEKLYRLAADAISIHNIWISTATEIAGFDSKGPIKISDYPLFYLLAVVDSIEPLRKFRKSKKNCSADPGLPEKWDKMTDKEILSEIRLSFDKDNRSLEITKKRNSCLKLSYMVTESTFENWLDVDVTINGEDSIVLKFR